ncbi:hypothetical protein ARSEF1564_006862 [Beauveria bassiana]
MITSSSSLQRKSPRSHEPPHYQQSPSRARQRSTSYSTNNAAALPHHSPSSRPSPPSSSSRRDSAASHRAPKAHASPASAARSSQFLPSSRAGPATFPSPPPSSSPAAVVPPPPPVDDANFASMDAIKRDDVSATHFHPSAPVPDSRQQQPSPPSDEYRIHATSAATSSAGPLAPPVDAPTAQTIVHIRDLTHITTLVQEGILGAAANGGPAAGQTQYEISAMPINDVIDMVAALLTKITTTNDLQHDAMQRNVAHQQQANQNHDSSGSHMTPLSHSVLAFHGKNVPAISILSYLGRIHKYCPTTYEVFLSLLVYFDRMTERVNDRVVKTERARQRAASQSQTYPAHSRSASRQVDTTMRDSTTSTADNSDETDSDLADDDDDDDDDPDDAMVNSPTARDDGTKPFAPEERHAASPATYFVVDSFNIHRLIISGVTCASKFFSDVFYTNSRYAKVGGLPLAELNHLELQFLILNDFRLAIPVEELEGYATMLVEFYAREVVAKGVGIK